jgi:Ca2+-binding RTX toxin-like protein
LNHTFDEAGDYTVTFTVSDNDGGTTEVMTDITISALFVDDDGNLVYGGSSENERIIVSFGTGGVQIRVNSQLQKPQLNPEGGGTVKIFGGGGNDTITVTNTVPFSMQLFGGDGNDYIAGGSRPDMLDGGAGTDRLLGGGGSDLLIGGPGNDRPYGGVGNDIIFGDGMFVDDGDPQYTIDDVQDAVDEFDEVVGGDDIMGGDAGNDLLFGGLGNDRANGGTGNDQLFGDDGNDTMYGDAGHDLLVGGFGSDRLYGRDGNDVLNGGEDADILLGGNGADLLMGDSFDEFDIEAVYGLWLSLGLNAVNTIRDNFLGGVQNDFTTDNLSGEGGSDWFIPFEVFPGLGDAMKDAKAVDTKEPLA